MNSSTAKSKAPREYPYFRLMVLIHATSGVIDAAVAVILATSALFAVDINGARISILLSLFATMIPFIVLAPAAALLVQKIQVPRIILALSLNIFRLAGLILMALAASQSSTTRLAIFPLAFVMLTLSKCYSVIKTSALPQVTTVESFPFFSSRLAMATGIVGFLAGSILFGLNRVYSESTTLYFSSVFVFVGICLAVLSYSRLGHDVVEQKVDADFDEIADKKLGEISVVDSKFSTSDQIEAVKLLFLFISSTRFVAGLIAIGVGLGFRTSTFMLGACFLASSISSFTMNAFAVSVGKTKAGNIIVYISGLVLISASVSLAFTSSKLSYIFVCVALGAFGAYVKIVYECRMSHLLPLDLNTLVLSRGEVIMQLAWVAGAVLAVITFDSFYLGAATILAVVLSLTSFRFIEKVLKKYNE